jgi:hypothetical protein
VRFRIWKLILDWERPENVVRKVEGKKKDVLTVKRLNGACETIAKY